MQLHVLPHHITHQVAANISCALQLFAMPAVWSTSRPCWDACHSKRAQAVDALAKPLTTALPTGTSGRIIDCLWQGRLCVGTFLFILPHVVTLALLRQPHMDLRFGHAFTSLFYWLI